MKLRKNLFFLFPFFKQNFIIIFFIFTVILNIKSKQNYDS